MGGFWRRTKERARSSCMPGAQTHPTTNARIEAMIRAATAFSAHVKRWETTIRVTHAANMELLSTTQTTMSTSLPQTFEETTEVVGHPSVVPTLPVDLVGGTTCDVGSVSRLGHEMVHQLETEVLAPLARWQAVHHLLVERSKKLNDSRLEVDARRHSMAKTTAKVSTMRIKMGDGGEGIKPEQRLDTAINALSHKEAQVKVASEVFEQQENQLAADLAALIEDGRYLKHYVTAALRLEGTALMDAAVAFGSSDPVVGSAARAQGTPSLIASQGLTPTKAPAPLEPVILSGSLAHNTPAVDSIATERAANISPVSTKGSSLSAGSITGMVPTPAHFPQTPTQTPVTTSNAQEPHPRVLAQAV